MNPRISFDLNYLNKDYILGIDEVGWGCVAGPVVLGGCLIPSEFYKEYINYEKKYPLFEKVRDSKKIRENKRIELFDFIKNFNSFKVL